MKSFQEFVKTIQEMKGDFGADAKMSDQPENCYGKTVKSCWSANSLGLLYISSSKLEEWEERMVVLKQQIQHTFFVEKN